jgi:hypothetical protein
MSPALRARVQANAADLPSLTECLPDAVQRLLDAGAAPCAVHRLSLCAAPQSRAQRLCVAVRVRAGRLQAGLERWQSTLGFVERSDQRLRPLQGNAVAADSLLWSALDGPHGHTDCVGFEIDASLLASPTNGAAHTLATLLQGFLDHPPRGVGLLMRIRNHLVRPLGLRTSTLGCPVSSLLNDSPTQRFEGRYPVLGQHVDALDRHAEVLLGADDKHLRFRACVSVRLQADGQLQVQLATRVQTRNLFGRIYMALIRRAHEAYVAPTLLRHALQPLLESETELRTQAAA